MMITLVFHIIRIILYYFHERFWERITWGKIKHPLSVLSVKGELLPEHLEIIRKNLISLGYT